MLWGRLGLLTWGFQWLRRLLWGGCILPLSHVLRLRPLLLLGSRVLSCRIDCLLVLKKHLFWIFINGVCHIRSGCRIGVLANNVGGTSLLPRVSQTRCLLWRCLLHRQDMLLSSVRNDFNHLSRIAKTLILLNETLVDLGEVEFLLAIW